MLWIIGGPTSVGKSTFIQSPSCQAITGVGAGARVVWPNSQDNLEYFVRNDGIYHYNLLRPENAYEQATRRASRNGRPVPSRVPTFDDDPPWLEVMAAPVPKRAVVLVASGATLLARIQHREQIEATELSGRDARPYNGERWQNILRQADLVSLYQAWISQLKQYGVPYQLILSEGKEYVPLDEAELPTVVRSMPATEEQAPTHG